MLQNKNAPNVSCSPPLKSSNVFIYEIVCKNNILSNIEMLDS